MTPERRVKNALIDGFYHVYGNTTAWHTSFVGGPVQKAGRPDYVLVRDGTTIWVEAKANRNGLSKLQQRVMSRMVASGAVVMIVRGEVEETGRIVGIESWAHGRDLLVSKWTFAEMKGPEFWHYLFTGGP